MSEEQINREFNETKEKRPGMFHIHFTDYGLRHYVSLLDYCNTTDSAIEDLWLPNRILAGYALSKRINCSYCSERFKEMYYGNEE